MYNIFVTITLIVFSSSPLPSLAFATELHNLSSSNGGLSYYQNINFANSSDKGNFMPENFWQSSVNESFQVNHDDLSSTLDTLRSFLAAMRKEREYQELTFDRNISSLLNHLTRLSVANIDLLGQQVDEDPNLLTNFKSSKDALQYSGRTLDCGGTSALGIFNFLTFVVYAFSLMVVLVQLVSGSMANSLSGTFLPNVLSILQQGRQIQELERPWDVLSRHLENSFYTILSGNLPKSRMKEESTWSLLKSNFMISRLKRSFRNIPTSRKAKYLQLLENEMGSELIIHLLKILGVKVDYLKCVFPSTKYLTIVSPRNNL